MAATVISTVLAPAADASLCSLADVKEELGLSDGDPARDAYLGKLIVRASAAITQYCNMIALPETVRDTVLPAPEPEPQTIGSDQLPSLQLSRFPVGSVASVIEGGAALTADVDFILDPANGRLIRLDATGLPCDWPRQRIVVEFSAGAAVPADLQDAAIRLVKARYFAKGRDPLLRSENLPGVREASWWVSASADDGNFPPDVADLLDDYRAPVIA